MIMSNCTEKTAVKGWFVWPHILSKNDFFDSVLPRSLISTCNIEEYNEFEQLILSLDASQNKAVYSESNALQITGGPGTTTIQILLVYELWKRKLMDAWLNLDLKSSSLDFGSRENRPRCDYCCTLCKERRPRHEVSALQGVEKAQCS